LGVETGGSGQSCAEQLSAARNQLIVESTATCINPLMAHGGGGAVLRMSPPVVPPKNILKGETISNAWEIYIFSHVFIILKKKISFLDRWLNCYQEMQNQFQHSLSLIP